MEFKWKLSAGAAAAALLTACGPGGEAGDGEAGAQETDMADTGATDQTAAGEGGEGEGGEGEGGEGEGGEGEGGEGEGGEGEGGATAALDPEARAVADFLLIRGHTMAGEALYAEGDRDLSLRHLRHPKVELYDESMARLQQYGAQAAAEAGDRIVTLSEDDAPAVEVSQAVAATFGELDAAMENVEASVAQRAQALSTVLDTARVEYNIGVIDGRIDNAAEYQDAWGFIRAAKVAFDSWRGEFDAADAEAASRFAERLEDLLDLHSNPLPTDNPPEAADFRTAITQAQLALLPLEQG